MTQNASPSSQPQQGSDHPFDLLLPESLTRPLWKSLAIHFRDRFFPEKLPPLHLNSAPMDIGMLLGDYLNLPWYRTVFTNLGDVINPETQPPLRLESHAVDVGELISDQLSHYWWASLLRNLADRIAPERLPALQLTSTPVPAGPQSGSVQIVRWSSLITLPRIPRPASPPAASGLENRTSGSVSLPPQPGTVRVPSEPATPFRREVAAAQDRGSKLQTALSRSRLREAVLIAVAVLEASYLLASFFGLL